MDKEKGKPSHKRFEDHSFIKRSAKFVKSAKLVNSFKFLDIFHHD